ncbi:TlpA disulfide reductase family protein [Sphingobacterium olei]|uniref:TlpA disulfide reductase family protein n=1 Tax=Sphingobacterium olei TaxID=2571155 RepID=UPI00138FE1AA|nr:TlpA disulfide reductase family protein [Sphingobacterium olei]
MLLCTALLYIASAFVSTSLYAQTPFSVNINHQRPADGYIVYLYSNAGKQHMDTVRAQDGRYQIHGVANAPVLLSLRYEQKGVQTPYEIFRKQRYRLLLDGGHVDLNVKDYLADAEVTGAPLQPDFLDYWRQIEVIHLQMQPLNMAKQRFEKSMQHDSIASYTRQLAPLKEAEIRFLSELIAKDPSTPVALVAVSDYNRPTGYNNAELSPLFAALDPKLQQMPMGLVIKATIDEQSAPLSEIQVPNFSLPDKDGVQRQFSAATGRYVLLDFWASWCTPCRNEHPALKEAYQDYHAKGFDIVSVSLDSSKDRWLSAIAEDQVGEWMQLSDLKGRKTLIAEQLQVTRIPYNLLLSPDGTVIAKNLRGLALNELLAKLLKK